MIVGLTIWIILLCFLLIKSADIVIVAIRRLSKELKTGAFTVSAIILAVGTSFPELFVGITSAIEGSSNLAFGVVLGSNIANIALVGGLASLVSGKVLVRGGYLKRDVWFALLAGVAPIFLALDGSVSRVDGLILLMVYFAYTTGFFKHRYEQIGKEQQEEGFVYRFLREFKHIGGERTKEFGKLFIGIALMLFTADAIVKTSSELAQIAGVPIFLVGLIILAIGTSLPELVFSIRSLSDREPSMFFGNLLGSTIANSTLIIGITTIIAPFNIVAFDEYLLAVIFFFIIFLSFWFFIRTKHRLDRWEALVLLALYLIFAISEFSRAVSL